MGITQTSRRKVDETPCVPCPNGYIPGNPGTFEELHSKVKNLYPYNFDGVKLIAKKVLSNHFHACHTIDLSSVTYSGYKFGVCYAGSKQVGANEKYPLIKGDIMPNGNLAASFSHTLGCRLRIKNVTQMTKNKCLTSTSTAEYRTDDYTLSLTLVDPDFIKQSGTIVLHYLQALSSRITLGIEIVCNRSRYVPGGQQSTIAYAMRYSTGPRTFSATIGEVGLHACYYHKASQQLQLGVEWAANMRAHDSIGTIVYKLDIPHVDMIFKGSVNTETTIGGLVEKKLYPMPETSLLLSAMLNHNKQQFRVGIGLKIG